MAPRKVLRHVVHLTQMIELEVAWSAQGMEKEDGGSRVVRGRVAGMKLKRRHGPEHGGHVHHEDLLSSK